ncbi:MAG TPA: zinc ribbon domain-containing protein [Chthonomonadales bacterium]|nr:zinc ribbon domain-containing protein [Chthonomonadales bacterium]
MKAIALAALMGLGGAAAAQRPDGTVEVRVEQRADRPGEARAEVPSDLSHLGERLALDLSHLGERLALRGLAGGLSERVSISVKDAPLHEALAKLLGSANVEHVIDDDVPKDRRITAAFENVRLSTALDAVCQSLGIGWTHQLRGGKWIVRITARPAYGVMARALTTVPEVVGEAMRGNPMLFWSAPETRSTFACPHCRGQVQVLRSRQPPRCPRCDRPFHGEWRFCPFDGARRPPAPGAWRFCPLCGKAVERERAATGGGAG